MRSAANFASAIKLYVEQHGDVVAGRRIEIAMRDDGGVADNARRIVQEMIVNDKVALIGIGITPTSLAIAPLITEARIATVCLKLGRLDHGDEVAVHGKGWFILAPQSWIMAEWAVKTAANVWLR